MIQRGTNLQVFDNSGIYFVKCLKIPRGFKKKYARIGDVLKVSIRHKLVSKKVPKNLKKVLGVVTGLRAWFVRRQGIRLRSWDNRILMLDPKNLKFMGTRVYGPLCYEMRNTKKQRAAYRQIISYSGGAI